MRFSRLFLLVALVLSAPSLRAQETGTIEVGAFGHYTSLDDDVQLGDSSLGFGGRLGLFLLRPLSVEAEYGFGTVDDNPRNVDAWLPLRLLAIGTLPITRSLKVYAGAGYKWETWSGDTTYNQYEDAFAFVGGLRVCLGGAWSLRPEIAYDYNPHPNFQPSVNSTSTYLGFRVGVSRFFGRGSDSCRGAEPPPAVVEVPATPPPAQQTPPPAQPPAAQTPPPAQPQAAPPPREVFRLDGVFFDFDRAELRPEGRTRLDAAVTTLNQIPNARVEIQGHTDSVGTDEYNQDLSVRRANAVRDYLVSRGITAARLTVRGFGESQPAANNATADGRQQNRRVVLVELP